MSENVYEHKGPSQEKVRTAKEKSASRLNFLEYYKYKFLIYEKLNL